VLDGTLTWRPFVEQTIAMVRSCHQYRYTLGPGWIGETQEEVYYVQQEEIEGWQEAGRRPYRIKLVGVFCDAPVAIARGLRRKIISGRGVPLRAQCVQSLITNAVLFFQSKLHWHFSVCLHVTTATLLHAGSDRTGCSQRTSLISYRSLTRPASLTQRERRCVPRSTLWRMAVCC
jgi:hypothetical protein